MALTDSLDSATAEVLALLKAVETSNARTIQAQDIGAADVYVLQPSPPVASYGPDLILLVDIANPNLTIKPSINVSGLGAVPILGPSGEALVPGALTGKCLFGFSTLSTGGYAARFITARPITALQIFQITQLAPPGTGFCGRQQRTSYQPQQADSSVLTGAFTAPCTGTVMAFSTLASTDQPGLANAIGIAVNGTAVAGSADSVGGSINNVTSITVAKGDAVVVTSTVSTDRALIYNTTQYLDYLFIPS